MRKVAKRARKVVRTDTFQGLHLTIEFPKGGKRPYVDDSGRARTKVMRADYGELRGTEGLDGDPVDVYVGPDKTAPSAFVVTQMKRGDWRSVDEEKVILGCRSPKEARALYLAHYDDPRFCGAVREMSMDRFKQRLAHQGQVGKKIAAAGRAIAELNYLRLQAGDGPLLGGQSGVKVSAEYRPASDWDDELSAEVKAKARREDPTLLPRLRRHAVGETEITRMEQAGLGIPEREIEDDPKDSKLRKAAALAVIERFVKTATKGRGELGAADLLGTSIGGAAGGSAAYRLAKSQPFALALPVAAAGALVGGVLGQNMVRAAKLRARELKLTAREKKAAADRVGRIADRVDDVGIGMLAAPYAAKALGAGLSHAPGRVGAAGKAMQAWGGREGGHTALELGGLALVAPSIGHGVARGIDRRVPPKAAPTPVPKIAGKALDAFKNYVRAGTQLGAVGALGVAGTGAAAVHGGAKLLRYHPHQGLAAPLYRAPTNLY